MKKQIKAIALALLSVTAITTYTSCTKESSTTGSNATATSGSIQFVNNSNNPYSVYINGSFKQTMSGKTSVTYSVTYGSYSCRVIQQSGYLIAATDKTYSGVVSASQNMIVSFP